MRFGIFGGSGFVATNVIDTLADTDHTVEAFDIEPIEELPDNASFSTVDITDGDAVDDAVEGLDVIAHMAAHQLPESLDHPRDNAAVNVVGTLNILEAAREHDVEKVFFPSASSILGSVEGDAASEDVVPDPRSPYGVAKHAVEEYLEVYQDLYDLDYLVFRFFNVYGPHQHPDGGAFVPVVMSRLARGEGVFVTGDGQQTRDFVYAEDVAEFIVEGLERDDVTNEVINMGHGRKVTLFEAIHTIADIVGIDPDIERRPERDDEIDDYCADMRRCEEVFGRTPETEFETGLDRTYDWMQSAVDLNK